MMHSPVEESEPSILTRTTRLGFSSTTGQAVSIRISNAFTSLHSWTMAAVASSKSSPETESQVAKFKLLAEHRLKLTVKNISLSPDNWICQEFDGRFGFKWTISVRPGFEESRESATPQVELWVSEIGDGDNMLQVGSFHVSCSVKMFGGKRAMGTDQVNAWRIDQEGNEKEALATTAPPEGALGNIERAPKGTRIYAHKFGSCKPDVVSCCCESPKDQLEVRVKIRLASPAGGNDGVYEEAYKETD